MIKTAHILIEVSDQEKSLMESYVDLHGVSLSDAIKTVFFEKLEDNYGLSVIRKYERDKPVRMHSMSAVKKELDL